jgi:hypothetical protein
VLLCALAVPGYAPRVAKMARMAGMQRRPVAVQGLITQSTWAVECRQGDQAVLDAVTVAHGCLHHGIASPCASSIT